MGTFASLGASHWISAISAIRRGNVFFSGSMDAKLRPWRFTRSSAGLDGDVEDKSLKLLPAAAPINAPGFINAIAVGKSMLACAIAKEHKAGRWFFDKSRKNGVMFVPLS